MELAIITAVFCGLALAIVLAAKRVDPAWTWTHPVSLFVLPQAAYSLCLPLSRIVFRTDSAGVDFPFMRAETVAIGALLLGFLAAVRKPGSKLRRQLSGPASVGHGRFLLLDASITLAFTVFLYTLHSSGGILKSILEPYGASMAGTDISEGQLSGFLGITALSAALLIGLSYKEQLGRSRYRFYVIVLLATIVLQILTGGRNLVLWIILPLAVLWVQRGRRVRLTLLLPAIAIGYLALQAIGVVRNFGFGRIVQAAPVLATESRSVFDPLRGELGTSYNVYALWSQMAPQVQPEPTLGRSIIIDPIVTLIPMKLWPGRPLTIAERFSSAYYGSLIAGLGFSGLTESISNFGAPGPFILYSLIGIGLAALTGIWRRLPTNGSAVVCYALLFPAFLNFNRIDVAIDAKLYLMRASVAVLLDSALLLQHVEWRIVPRRTGRRKATNLRSER